MKNINISLRSLFTAAWLSWQIESNWTDPFLFAIYSIIKPLSAAGILVVMYTIITNGDFSSPVFSYLFLGNAFYQYVPALLSGVSWSIIEDREHYRTLKYFFIAPIDIPMFLFGRSLSKFLSATISVLITTTIGVIFLKVPLILVQVDWSLFIWTMLLGIINMSLLGLLLAGVTLITVRHSYYIGEVVAAGLILFTGAVFPLDVLPVFFRAFGYLLPITYWLELIRRSLIGNVAENYQALSAFTNNQLVFILIGTNIIIGVISWLVFQHCNNIALEKGLIDNTSEY